MYVNNRVVQSVVKEVLFLFRQANPKIHLSQHFYRVFMIAIFLWPFVCRAPETHWESWSPEVRSLKIIGDIGVLCCQWRWITLGH